MVCGDLDINARQFPNRPVLDSPDRGRHVPEAVQGFGSDARAECGCRNNRG